MKQKHKKIQRVLHWMQLPEDLDPHLLAIQMIGDASVLIEQHRGILRYNAEQIRFQSEQGILLVCGLNLAIEKLTETRAMICGEIHAISYEDKS